MTDGSLVVALARRVEANVRHQDGDYAGARPLCEAALDGFVRIGNKLRSTMTAP